MELGEVTGIVRLKKSMPQAETIPWMQVKLGARYVVAADLAGAAPGDLALVCTGPEAGRFLLQCPADAAIVGILENPEKMVDKPRENRL